MQITQPLRILYVRARVCNHEDIFFYLGIF